MVNVFLSGLRILRWLLDFWATVTPSMLGLTVVVYSGVVDTSCKERCPTQKDAIYAVVVVKINRDVRPRICFLRFNIDRHSGQHTTTLPTSMIRNGEQHEKMSNKVGA
jgi:hypothetical protein